ncbi:MAG: ABC transporter ATP-binding protein [Eubacteriales bacterium]|nr:ABC transporter ATP-binding protein [Eubacteriales bacterium]
MQNDIIQTQGLSKKYGKKFAIKNINAHIKPGEIYGLIGRNGAGKTTLMKCINGQIQPTDGNIFVDGKAYKDQSAVRIGSLVESPNLYGDCSAYENLMYKCIALNIKDKKRHIAELLELVELDKTGKKKAKQFSLGMKQRLGLALAMVSNPKVLMLDEPINGMDPQGIAGIRETLVKLNRDLGTTIIISSHILDELAKFATRYGIIKDGELITEFSSDTLENESLSSVTVKSPNINEVYEALKEKYRLSQENFIDANTLKIQDGAEKHREISRFLYDKNIYLEEFRVDHMSLEDYFMHLTGGEKP